MVGILIGTKPRQRLRHGFAHSAIYDFKTVHSAFQDLGPPMKLISLEDP